MAESNAFIGFDGFYYVFVNNTGLGIKIDTLYTWISKAKNGKVGFCDDPGNTPLADPNRLKQLEKELREAKEEIEILQDALGFFVKRRKK